MNGRTPSVKCGDPLLAAYGPLYQAAYLLGGMQLYRATQRTSRRGQDDRTGSFNDAVLKENRIPIEMIRADLTNQKLTPDYHTTWKFYGEHPGQ